jgi:hypothetical protein
MPIDPPSDIEIELVDGVDDGVAAPRPGATRPAARRADGAVELAFAGELWHWRGPAPYHFVSVPPDAAAALRSIAAEVTYGWGMIPVEVRIGRSTWTTALMPKDGGYVVPVKDRYRLAEELALGDVVAIQLVVRRSR